MLPPTQGGGKNARLKCPVLCPVNGGLCIGAATYITKLDLLKGYWHVPKMLLSPLIIFSCRLMPFGMQKGSSLVSQVHESSVGWHT